MKATVIGFLKEAVSQAVNYVKPIAEFAEKYPTLTKIAALAAAAAMAPQALQIVATLALSMSDSTSGNVALSKIKPAKSSSPRLSPDVSVLSKNDSESDDDDEFFDIQSSHNFSPISVEEDTDRFFTPTPKEPPVAVKSTLTDSDYRLPKQAPKPLIKTVSPKKESLVVAVPVAQQTKVGRKKSAQVFSYGKSLEKLILEASDSTTNIKRLVELSKFTMNSKEALSFHLKSGSLEVIRLNAKRSLKKLQPDMRTKIDSAA